ncbi:hypothetical protein A2U01_0069036, partial [Trifolium medium]|nr:hypothetical protein [Trifolium medium]
RVKVVTKTPKLIDTILPVKVHGIRFDIRIIEEAGSWPEFGGGCVRRGPVWHEAQSSRASFGAFGVAAA